MNTKEKEQIINLLQEGVVMCYDTSLSDNKARNEIAGYLTDIIKGISHDLDNQRISQ